jgi:hypothetical protein
MANYNGTYKVRANVMEMAEDVRVRPDRSAALPRLPDLHFDLDNMEEIDVVVDDDDDVNSVT